MIIWIAALSPAKVVDFIIDLKKKYNPENIICLMGNHERMFLDFLQGQEEMFFLLNGGASTAVSYWGNHWERRERLLPPDMIIFLQP